MSPKPILHQINLSPSSRTVIMVAKEIGLELEIKHVDMLNEEHLTPEYLEMNPQHTVPTLDDNGQYIWDSHAISTYLIGKYGKSDDHPLYPKDLYTRARIDQRLHFNNGVLFPAIGAIFKPVYHDGLTEFPEKPAQAIHVVLGFLETFLATDEYMVGNSLTVADLAIVPLVTQYSTVLPIDAEKYPKLLAWIKRLEELPYYKEINGSGLEVVKGFFASIFEKNKAAKQ